MRATTEPADPPDSVAPGDETGDQTYDTGQFGRVRVIARRCPLCDRDDGAGIAGYGAAIWQVVRCRLCRFVYLDRAPDYEALFAQMAWEKTTVAEVDRRAQLRPLSHRLSKATRLRMRLLPRKKMGDLVRRHAPLAPGSPGNVVDLGCGSGTQLAGLDPGYVPFGVEISAELARAADTLFRARGGRAVNQPALLGLATFPDGFFAAAILRSYLEHELAPRAVLEALHRTLAPGGVALVKLPNYGSLNRLVTGRKWCGFRYPDHVNYFTPASLRAMAERCGYRVRFGLTDRLPTSDNMYAVLTRL
jgi:SAM-dependent methyltransferase